MRETKLLLLTWKQDSEGTEARRKFSINFPLALSNWMGIFFSPMPQNNIQQVFRRLHALLVEEYSGEDLQIIACPSTEQVQLTGNWHILMTLQQPSKNTAETSAGPTQLELISFVHLFQINLLLSVNK